MVVLSTCRRHLLHRHLISSPCARARHESDSLTASQFFIFSGAGIVSDREDDLLIDHPYCAGLEIRASRGHEQPLDRLCILVAFTSSGVRTLSISVLDLPLDQLHVSVRLSCCLSVSLSVYLSLPYAHVWALKCMLTSG